MPTIKEVAKRARVSVGTVSNVLGGSVPVSPAIKQRVLKAIEALDYHPDHFARSLKTRQSHMIGMVIPDITNPFFPQLVRGAEDAALRQNYLLITFNTDDQVDREKRVLSLLRTRRTDGVLLVMAPNHGQMEHIEKIIASGVPIVAVDRAPVAGISSVAVDNIRGSEMCVRHLISLGHRRIALLGGSHYLQNAAERLRGYENALREANLPVDRELILEGDFRLGSGYLLTKQIWLSGRRPTALFVCNSMMGLGALKALKEMRVDCPEDVALAVFDDIPGNGSFYPEITTVVQPAYEIGFKAAEVLIEQIETGYAAAADIRLSPELRIRESTLPVSRIARRLDSGG
ncbi:MAG: LacI family DNA-binding transcriptional regulator [Bryobacteraceae bacterium]